MGLSLSPVGLSLSPVGLSLSPMGLSLSPVGLCLCSVRLSLSFVTSNGISMNRIIEQEVEIEPFHVSLMLQRRVVKENKKDPVFLVPKWNSFF